MLGEDGRDVEPGSGQSGVLALGGRIPLGYYKDEAKTAATFRTIDGTRYSVPGDYAQVSEDGSIHLLGRGSVSINTGGEKVYPEEVEEVVKTIDGVVDAVVVGIPDERFGEEIVAVVELAPGTPPDQVTESSVIEHVKSQAGRVQGTAPCPLRDHHRAVAFREGRLRQAPGRGRRVGRGDLGLTGGCPCRGLSGERVSPCWRRRCGRSR